MGAPLSTFSMKEQASGSGRGGGGGEGGGGILHRTRRGVIAHRGSSHCGRPLKGQGIYHKRLRLSSMDGQGISDKV